MKNKIIKISIFLTIIIILSLIIYNSINVNLAKDKSLDNIKNIYNIITNTNIDNINISGNLKTEHTSNLVHSSNKIYEKNYNFSLEKKDEYLYLYLDDKVSKINIDKYYQQVKIENISNCKYLNKTKTNKTNKYTYSCNDYKLSIYTSKFLNNYLKSEIIFNDTEIEFYKDNVNYNNNYLKINISNIKKDNYTIHVNANNHQFKIFYSYNNYHKYSFLSDKVKFNIIIDKDLILSMNCNTQKYSYFLMTINKQDIQKPNNLKEISLKEMLEIILSKEISSLFEK